MLIHSSFRLDYLFLFIFGSIAEKTTIGVCVCLTFSPPFPGFPFFCELLLVRFYLLSNLCIKMYRFMIERTIFNRLQRQAISVSKRYYQCNEVGVYGYRPKKVEPFQRKLV